jgi:hypothetical protein
MKAGDIGGYRERLERTVFNPLTQTSVGFYLLVLVLLGVVGWGL